MLYAGEIRGGHGVSGGCGQCLGGSFLFPQAITSIITCGEYIGEDSESGQGSEATTTLHRKEGLTI